jgi:hypothetical protein
MRSSPIGYDLDLPSWIRIAGRDAPAGAILADAAATGAITKLHFATAPDPDAEDDSLIDPLLERAPEPSMDAPPDLANYAAFSPGQRTAFLAWLRTSDAPAPPAFLAVALAHLEIGLFAPQTALPARNQLLLLHENAAWHREPALERTLLLYGYLTDFDPPMREWLFNTNFLPEHWGLILGWQARLAIPLSEQQLPALIRAWGLAPADNDPDATRRHIYSLRENLGKDPLRYAHDDIYDASFTPEETCQPWLGAHRQVRLRIPQPNLRPVLEPLLRDMLKVRDVAPALATKHVAKDESTASAEAPMKEAGWHLILEFGQSRSEYFDFALTLAQRIDSFSQLVDEDRKVVYRVMFQKDKLRDFWRLWNYVEKWSSTRVYVRGEEIEKWKVWRYSQFLR